LYVTTDRKRSLDKLDALTDLRFTVTVQAYILGIRKHPRLKLVRAKAIIETNKTDITILGNAVISCSV
jgi:hypothetical protein